jgi:hypothetical protein
VELRVEYVEHIHFSNTLAFRFLYKAKDLSTPLPSYSMQWQITPEVANAYGFRLMGHIVDYMK